MIIQAGLPSSVLSASSVSPLTYGAKFDGVTDDAAAWQNALNVAAGGVLRAPDGISIIGTPLEVAPGTTITGASHGGTILRAKPGANLAQILGVTKAGQLNYSVLVEKLILDGNRAAGATVTQAFYGLSLNDSILDKLRIINSSGNGIVLDGATGYLGSATKILNTFIRSCGGDGIDITADATDTQLVACDVGDCGNFGIYLGGHHTFMSACAGWGSGNGLYVDSTGGHLYCSSSRFDANSYEGIILLGGNIQIGDTLALNNSQAANAGHAGIQIGAAANQIDLNAVQSYGAYQVANNQSYGLQLLAGHTYVRITGGNYLGNATGAITGQSTTANDRIVAAAGAADL